VGSRSADTPCPQCGTPMRLRLTSNLEELICPKCGSSLSRKVEPQKPLARSSDQPSCPECPQCKVSLKPLVDEEEFDQDRQIWECEQCGYQVDLFTE
jgi:ssDNA-binding Zn-finger/Zn-ribbon topoisomerase 1